MLISVAKPNAARRVQSLNLRQILNLQNLRHSNYHYYPVADGSPFFQNDC